MKHNKKARLKIHGDELDALIGNAGFFIDCGDIGLVAMRKTSASTKPFRCSVTKGEFECLLGKINFILQESSKFNNKKGREYKSLVSLYESLSVEYRRQILGEGS